MTTDDDTTLYLAWCRGDREAGTRLFRRNFDDIFTFFVHKVGNDADELTQRVFEACVAARDRFRGDASFRGFLFGIARFQLLRWLRARGRHPVLEPDAVSLAEVRTTPSQAVALRERQLVLLTAMRNIPLDFQVTLELYYWHGLTIPEIAEALEIAPGTVKSRLSRAKALLREELHRGSPGVTLEDEAIEAETRELRKALA